MKIFVILKMNGALQCFRSTLDLPFQVLYAIHSKAKVMAES